MDDEEFEILKAAVNIARFKQVKRLSDLRERLLKIYPGKETRIDNAFKFWAANVSSPV